MAVAALLPHVEIRQFPLRSEGSPHHQRRLAKPLRALPPQPESKLFVNTSINAAKGIGANNFPWNSSYAAWGGYLKIAPLPWYYLQGGLYEAIPFAADTQNHGLDFAGYARDPHLNGLYALAETGFTPKIGPAQLPGRYAFGAIYWGIESKSFNGAPYDGRVDFYWQADQQLFRESSPAPAEAPSDGKSVADGKEVKSFRSPVPAATPKLNEQGLYFFSQFSFAPKFQNLLPFYFQTGLVYKGLIPSRDLDKIGVAFGLGEYSYTRIESRRTAGQSLQKTYEGVLEADYQVQVNKWLYVKPFFQYVIRPSAEGEIENSTVLGAQAGVVF